MIKFSLVMFPLFYTRGLGDTEFLLHGANNYKPNCPIFSAFDPTLPINIDVMLCLDGGCSEVDDVRAGQFEGCATDNICSQVESVCADGHVNESGVCENKYVCEPDNTSVWIGSTCTG